MQINLNVWTKEDHCHVVRSLDHVPNPGRLFLFNWSHARHCNYKSHTYGNKYQTVQVPGVLNLFWKTFAPRATISVPATWSYEHVQCWPKEMYAMWSYCSNKTPWKMYSWYDGHQQLTIWEKRTIKLHDSRIFGEFIFHQRSWGVQTKYQNISWYILQKKYKYT